MPVCSRRLFHQRSNMLMRASPKDDEENNTSSSASPRRGPPLLSHSDSSGSNSCESTVPTSSPSRKPKGTSKSNTNDKLCQNPGRSLPKHVSFGSVRVRRYEVIVGDHPCCPSGCPLALGWHFEQQDAEPLDGYEAHHPPSCLKRTTCLERHHRLVEQQPCSPTQAEREIRHQCRHHHRHRDRRVQKAQQEEFFSGGTTAAV